MADVGEHFRIEERGEGRFALQGVLGFATATALLERSRKLFDRLTHIEIDLGAVTQADSAGLALLIEWLSWKPGNGQTIVFRNLPEQIRSLARISEVESLLPEVPAPTREEQS